MNLRSLAMAITFAALAVATLPASAASRDPVFKHASVPHSYYWREMYAPQLTSGPSGLSWACDGKSLYFSMQGRIWRQKIASTGAEQITGGAGYDYQPDLSPDGRSLVIARRLDDAIDLVVIDVKSGKETKVASNGALNFDARWSPDGRQIAYVSTADSGNFHIAIAEIKDGAWSSRRWRSERTTEIPRYYYAQTDHELSPAWSPDGEELVFVSNADVIHGTGRIVRQRLDLSTPPQIVRDEETNWKAHPDWSPDGARIAYASYLGRQWHQLWLTTASAGGYPMPFTYGDYDLTGARWSPDGNKIAAISNASGNLAIEIIDVIGGARTRLEQASRKEKGAMAALRVRVTTAAGEPTPARIQIRASDGRDYAPDGALIHADDYRDPDKGVETHYFHGDGDDLVRLPPGLAEIRVWRGLSSAPTSASVMVARRGETAADIRLNAIDSDFATWRSGDVHTHMNYGGAYRMNVAGVAAQADAEALDLVFNLIVNKEQRIPDIAEFSPVPARPEGARAVIAQAQEFHTSVWGHLGLIGLDDHLLMADYAGYPRTAASSLYPDNSTVADLAHRQKALVGYVHPYDPPAPDPFDADRKLTHALPVDVALGLVDYVEVVGFSDHRSTEEVWRRLLNCGFRIPAAGGADAMINFASLRGPLGLDRTYVDLGPNAPTDPATFARAWLDGLKAGKSFATNSALLSLSVEGAGPGAELRFKKGMHKLKFSAGMQSVAAMTSLDLIINGEVAQKLALSKDGMSAAAEGEFEIDASSWIALRASNENASADVFDLYPFAVTSPVYVTVGGKALRSDSDADYFIAWIDRLSAFARASDAFNTEEERATILAHFAKARREFERRR